MNSFFLRGTFDPSLLINTLIKFQILSDLVKFFLKLDGTWQQKMNQVFIFNNFTRQSLISARVKSTNAQISLFLWISLFEASTTR